MTLVNLFSYREYIQLVQVDRNVQLVNWPMIQYDTKIYQGVTNVLDFVVRNNERRPINLSGTEMWVIISNQETGEILARKDAEVTSALEGKARLVLEPYEIEDWPVGYYDYSVSTNVGTDQTFLLFTDINKSTTGYFELFPGVIGGISKATEILASQFTQTPVGNADDIMYVSGAYPGDAQSNRANGQHTVAVYQTRWLGKFFIQASLSNDSPLPSEWFYVPLTNGPDPMYTFDRTNNSGDSPTLFNFSGNYYWVRFGYLPVWSPLVGYNGEYDPINVNEYATLVVNDGVFHKVLFKN